MKELVVLSGKGGSGKTTVAAALASLASREMSLVLADTDVDAGNLELLMAPRLQEEHAFIAGQVGFIDPEECIVCGACQGVCRFGAIAPPAETDPSGAYRIDPVACEGCASCFHACPSDAIRMEAVQAGLWRYSETRYGPLFHARLFAGGENSGKLVTTIRQEARKMATLIRASLLLVDGPPGIGCPVISTLSGADLALIVTEPTIAGVHDLERVLGLAEHFGVRSAVVINKADLNTTRTSEIERLCRSRALPLLGRIPYDLVATESMIQGLPATEHANRTLADPLTKIWTRLKDTLEAHEAPHGRDVGRKETRHGHTEIRQ